MRVADQSALRARVDPVPVVASVVAVALVSWLLVVDRMGGMEARPGTDLGTFWWFLGVWLTMMVAMMLPSVAPMVLLFALVDTYARSKFEDTRRKAQKFGARGTTVKAYKP